MRTSKNKKECFENQILTSSEMGQLAHHTCQWWGVVLHQAERFLNAFSAEEHDPWKATLFVVPERMLLITAIHHALVGLKKLNSELLRYNNPILQPVVTPINNIVPIKHFRDLRNMNEHYWEYMVGLGNKKEDFKKTAPQWTIVHGEKDIFRFGVVNIGELIVEIKKQSPEVKKITKKIFEWSYVGKALVDVLLAGTKEFKFEFLKDKVTELATEICFTIHNKDEYIGCISEYQIEEKIKTVIMRILEQHGYPSRYQEIISTLLKCCKDSIKGNANE